MLSSTPYRLAHHTAEVGDVTTPNRGEATIGTPHQQWVTGDVLGILNL